MIVACALGERGRERTETKTKKEPDDNPCGRAVQKRRTCEPRDRGSPSVDLNPARYPDGSDQRIHRQQKGGGKFGDAGEAEGNCAEGNGAGARACEVRPPR